MRPFPTRKVRYLNFQAQYLEDREAILACVDDVFLRGDFIDGEAVAQLEETIADFCGSKYAVALNSGTDALILSLKALNLGPGDEVITAPNSFVASAGAIAAVGATPVFCDVGDDFNIDPDSIVSLITGRTRAIMPVHLTGRISRMVEIMELAQKHGLAVIEDAAQSFGSRLAGRHSGTFGDIGCFSAHPLKNLNAAGDAGFIITDKKAYADRIRLLRNHGLVSRDNLQEWGTVSRMDTIQAKILLLRLEGLAKVIECRRNSATLYRNHLVAAPVRIPACRSDEFNTFHTFIVEADRRNELHEYLAENGVETKVHYPIPIHLQPPARALGYGPGDFPNAESQAARILSLPIHQHLDAQDIEYVCKIICDFYQKQG